ncbi:hypothetical protein VTJ49DRAFT_6234 [Mycothermus thermophilus]|uniref:NDT80 domain-containing protein n=1 Tax=Humicola insolens TaxID=85995 RepID=A0ABR3VKH3_HUMIN
MRHARSSDAANTVAAPLQKHFSFLLRTAHPCLDLYVLAGGVARLLTRTVCALRLYYNSFTQGSTASLSTIETPPQPPSYLSLIPPVAQPPVTPYTPETGHFYTPAPPVFSGLEVRSRLGSNGSTSTAGQGMAHAHRSTTLPHPGLSTRDLYSSATPGFRRPDHHHHHNPHVQRSPPFSSFRRHNPFSPSSAPAAYGSLKMDAGGFSTASKTQANIPPLLAMTTLGHLSYSDSANTPIKIDISGVIDKGFFIAENEWTCYRRNYFSCVCSFSLTPLLHNTDIQFQPTGTTQVYKVNNFAMCISAVVSDNDNHTIELVQHTPKRDKGPIAPPDKVRLQPKPPQSHHPLTSLYAAADGSLGSSRYSDQGIDGPFGQPRAQGSSLPTEHTFERIQFKQATANNGKRRAAQQYYHLIVELWADIGQQQQQQQPGSGPGTSSSDHWIKVAYRKSAKMIVRGRSPGHYQSERRGSSSSGPGAGGGAGGGSNGYQLSIPGQADYPMGGYGQAYDPRPNPYGGSGRTHELNMDSLVSADEVKALNDTKGYQYYAATLYETDHEPRHQTHQSSNHHNHHHHAQQHQHHQHQHQQQQTQTQQNQQPVELFSHSRPDVPESGGGGSSSTVSGAFDPTRVKSELDQTTAAAAVAAGGLPSLIYQGGPYYSQRCGRFEGKPTSTGQYPTGAAGTTPNLMAPSVSSTPTMSMT